MTFEPIAIVGQSCVLPGALSPDQLWQAVSEGRDLISTAPKDRWGLDRTHAMGTTDASQDRTWSDRGGYVEGFEAIFDPAGFALPEHQSRRARSAGAVAPSHGPRGAGDR